MAEETEAATRPEDDIEMGFFEHLGELRVRLLRSLIGVLPGLAVGGYFHKELLGKLLQPYEDAFYNLARRGVELPMDSPTLITLSPYSMFVAYMKVAIIAGVAVGAPWIFWQFWQFVAPGLYRREKRLAVPFVIASTIFFIGGASFGYFVVFPILFEYFISLSVDTPVAIEPMYSIDEVFSLEFRLLIAFGLVFELPVINSFLSAAGIITWRQLLAFSRWWILVSAVLSALLTPPDWTSQLLMMGPLIFLYFVSIVFAAIFGRKPPTERLDETVPQ